MQIKNREQMLALVAIAAVALFAGDKVIRAPLTRLWKARAEQIVTLRKQVEEGRKLILNRDVSLHSRWEQMRTNTLPNNTSLAEQQVLKAFDTWAQESRVSVTSISPQWKRNADDFMTLDCRVEASGNLATVSRFLYDIEKDAMALKLDSVEITARDKDGQQISLGLQISGLVLNPPEQKQ
ncbi:MAG: hypothetical protein HY298_05600 [Verrucomicrobia bacterium]|nr:hypothetical protein [Verrucomicrobiota bacterium]